ncbi:MAG: hypothetical protein OEZ48_05675, partial [Candidatus Bathyarchaeota archaeon]|nr:hypothetical protein [Candidatus Bathyarchaeota archaeon]
MRKSQPIRVFSLIVVMILNVVFQSSLIVQLVSANPGTPIPPPRTGANLRELVEALNSTTPPENRTDTDGDGMWDLVEAVIGTDFNNTDSDFDRLNDTFEVWNNLDPLEPDSNNDGLSDYHEVMNVSSPNVDGDNLDNAWDFDNDDDGVNDHIDLSPFSKSITSDRFHFEIKTNGNPLYIIFQLIPENPDYLKLFYQSWDWPDNDREGSMKDLDNSKQDVSMIPILNLTANVLPNQSDVMYYGILVTPNGIHVPLYPVFEYGTIVAFAGKMVYPASAPVDLTLDAELFWRVNGITDEKAKALKTTSGNYFSLSVSGAVLANSSSITPLETFQWIDLGDNTIAMKALNGLYLSVADNGTVVANSIGINERESFELASKGDIIALKAYNGLYVSVAADGTVVANSTAQEVFQLIDMGAWPEATVLATYNDAFMLTGFSVQENYGSDLGLFYSEDVNQTFAANLLSAYDFLRNSTTHVLDMPPIIADYDLSLSALSGSFSHKDEAFQSMANEMTPDALNSLPGNRVLPVVAIVEDSFAGLDLSQIASGSYIAGYFLTADLTSEPIVTSKTLKTDWYNTSSHQALEIDDIVTEIWSWGSNETLFANLIGLAMAWNTGEQTITSIGSSVTKFETPEKELVNMQVRKIGKVGFKVLTKFVVAPSYRVIQSLRLLRNLKAAGWSISVKGSTSWLKIMKLQLKKAFSAKTLLTSSSRIGNTMALIGAFVEIGLAIYSLFSIGESLDWSPQGTHMALTKALLQTTYAVIMFNIAMIPYVGWVIALVFGIIDLFGDYSGKLIGWMMSIKVTGSVTPGIEIAGEPSLTTYDKDDNGLDVGDRIEYISRLKGKVSGRWDLVRKSSIFPYYDIYAPPGSSSTTGYVYPGKLPISTNITMTQDPYGGWRANEYEAGVWIEPGIGMPNFPVNIGIKAYYDLWYEWEHFVWLVFYWFYCSHKGWEEGFTSGGGFTLRFDVMPGNLSDFVSWRSITALDHDGDRLLDSEETTSDRWRFDTDGDGLNDKYEVDIGTDPKQFDTDKDGLIDWFELVYDTNVTEPDTDGDGLRDFLEVAGWVISFNYTDDPTKPFTTRVYSDPRVPDTDRDGVDDYIEYWSGLNPRSSDTNGDGIDDVANPKFDTTSFEFVESWNVTLGSNDEVMDMAIDANGDIYVATYRGTILKYSPNGTLVAVWNPDETDIISSVSVAVDDKNGYVHVFDSEYYSIWTFDYNGTVIRGLWGQGDWPRALAVDSEGCVYAARGGPYYDNIWTISVEKYHSNGTFITSWGSWGTDPEQFAKIDDMAIDKNGIVYISDIGELPENVSIRDDRIAKFDVDGNYKESIYDVSSVDYDLVYIPWLSPYWGRLGVAVDEDDYLYIADSGNHRILKYDQNGMFINSTGSYGWEDGNFIYPRRVAVSSDGYVYVVDGPDNRTDSGEERIFRIQKFSQEIEPAPPFEDPVPDRDGDGLENTAESAGWNVTFTNTTGTFTIHVTSDPLLNDTDFEGLSDYNESQIKTHPRDPDTDDDGLSDYAEWRGFSPKTNPKHWDTDEDGLGDGAEISFGSDPTNNDTDDDGLSDFEEFELGSNPRDPDTDRDGAKDKKEKEAKSDLKDPDSDNDFMFDGMELNIGTDPNNNDTDKDHLPDGHEILFNTNPLNNDTDNDHLPDGLEVGMFLDPTSNDTDKDGVPDGTELEWGTNPWSNDTDRDGIPDNLDLDSNSTHVKNIILAFDLDPENATREFADRLAQYTNVTTVSTDELLINYTDSPHIVLVGRPDGNGTVGNLIKDLLADTGDVLTKMIESDEDRLAVRYGIWDSTQTVVMLSHPYPLDHLRVLDILRSKTVTVLPDWVMVEYLLNTFVKYPSGGSLNHTEISYDFFKMDEIDTV